jgi:hypothetical protein
MTVRMRMTRKIASRAWALLGVNQKVFHSAAQSVHLLMLIRNREQARVLGRDNAKTQSRKFGPAYISESKYKLTVSVDSSFLAVAVSGTLACTNMWLPNGGCHRNNDDRHIKK